MFFLLFLLCRLAFARFLQAPGWSAEDTLFALKTPCSLTECEQIEHCNVFIKRHQNWTGLCIFGPPIFYQNDDASNLYLKAPPDVVTCPAQMNFDVMKNVTSKYVDFCHSECGDLTYQNVSYFFPARITEISIPGPHTLILTGVPTENKNVASFVTTRYFANSTCTLKFSCAPPKKGHIFSPYDSPPEDVIESGLLWCDPKRTKNWEWRTMSGATTVKSINCA